MQVVVDTKSINRSKSNLITSIIYLDFGDSHFPDGLWSDFSLSVLYDWAYVLSNESFGEFDLNFWEGPYLVKAQRGEYRWTARCIVDRDVEKEVHSAEFDIGSFKRSIRDAGHRILESDEVNSYRDAVHRKVSAIDHLLDFSIDR